jgi:AcrR family transcriptional regulator
MTDSEDQRDSYHHGDLRQAILDAACEYLGKANADSLSLRALARKIGVSQTAPYRHFDSRNALFAAIATWGFNILEEDLRKAQENSQALGSGEVLIATAMAYLAFSESHREKYQLFFNSSLVDFEEYEDLQLAGDSCFEVMLEMIRQGKNEGVFLDRPEEELAATIWSGLHGMASLLPLNRNGENFVDRSVGKAVSFLVRDRREAVSRLLNSICR